MVCEMAQNLHLVLNIVLSFFDGDFLSCILIKFKKLNVCVHHGIKIKTKTCSNLPAADCDLPLLLVAASSHGSSVVLLQILIFKPAAFPF